MNNIELLQCLIETEINKINYQIKIAHLKGNKIKKKYLYSKLAGFKTSLNFIEEIENMED